MTWDHPRLCGKDSSQQSWCLEILGSPPLMREGLDAKSKLFELGGITPAYAGRTISNRVSLTGDRDHPRLCGKDGNGRARQYYNAGSPPLMREGLNFRLMDCPETRITPAYAGRTSSRICCGGGEGDHPRLCGKDLALYFYQN